jgi:hypothetical protein
LSQRFLSNVEGDGETMQTGERKSARRRVNDGVRPGAIGIVDVKGNEQTSVRVKARAR